MAFKLGTKSRNELKGVHPDLVRVVELAITLTEVDFSVHDGIRSLAEQREYVKRGVSKTMKSKHLDGLAVDLVPWINGRLRWEWPAIYKIAEAMHEAATELNVTLRWGGVWDRTFNHLPGSALGLEDAVEDYVARRRKKGLRAFIDGPHFELKK